MKIDQRSIWEAAPSSIGLEQNDDDQQQQRHTCRRRLRTILSSCCGGCSGSFLGGLIVGALAVGVALATVLALFLLKPGADIMTTSTATSFISSSATTSTSSTTTSTITVTSTTTSAASFNINLITNGDAETGTCGKDGTITSPTEWSFNGPISQVSFNNTVFTDPNYTTPGPSDRGNCYFTGQISASTSMWQTINLTNQVDPFLIDSQTVKFNLSAWMGGITNQDDSVVISLTFVNQVNQMVGNVTSIGPVLAINRMNISSFLFQQANGLVPIGSRSSTLLVTMTRFSGAQNNGDVDNIAVYLYQ